MTSAQPTEVEALSGRVLRIIGAYGMHAALDARDSSVKNAPAALPPRQGPLPERAARAAERPPATTLATTTPTRATPTSSTSRV